MDTNDPNIARAIQNMAATTKDSFSWTRDKPCSQPYYTYSAAGNRWEPFTPPPPSHLSSTITHLTLFSWNIDFMLPLPAPRMTAALAHLYTLIQPLPPTTATIIFLQEMLVSDLTLIQSTPWIRDSFNLTDLDTTHWESGYYGTCTLIDKSLPITSVFRVHYAETKMQRDGLFIDVQLHDNQKRLRLCNTHLESLAMSPPLRPAQMNVAAQYLHDRNLSGAILAGDLNAIQPFDRTLHIENGLKDAYLELGGMEDSDKGFTWGQQAQMALRERFGCSRMDKVLFCGSGIECVQFERFGMHVQVKEDEEQEVLIAQGLQLGWVTDHLGVRAEFKIK